MCVVMLEKKILEYINMRPNVIKEINTEIWNLCKNENGWRAKLFNKWQALKEKLRVEI